MAISQDQRVKRAMARLNDPYLIFFRLSFLIASLVKAIIVVKNAIDRTFPNWFSNFKSFLVDVSLSPGARLAGILIFGMMSYLLLLFKKNARFYYGLVESIVALAGLYFMTEGLQEDSINFVQAFAAIYLCVRGFDNIWDGTKEENWPSTFAGKLLTRKKKQQVQPIQRVDQEEVS